MLGRSRHCASNSKQLRPLGYAITFLLFFAWNAFYIYPAYAACSYPNPPNSYTASAIDSTSVVVSFVWTLDAQPECAPYVFGWTQDLKHRNPSPTWTEITPYKVDSPQTITGLIPGTNYTIRLAGKTTGTGFGDPSGCTSASSTCSLTFTTLRADLPPPPTSLSATPGDGQVNLSFAAGIQSGVASELGLGLGFTQISNYKYSLDGITYTALSTADATSPITIPGLTNGTPYTINLKAINANGDSIASDSVTVTPGLPLPPTSLVATVGDGVATIYFTAGANGGSAISNYYYSLDGTLYTALSTPDATSPITIPGLASGTPYTFYLKAVNANGNSTASNSVTVLPDLPFPPTSLAAAAGSNLATISFTAGSENGFSISNYKYSINGTTYSALSTPDGTSPITIPGLTNGTAYTIYLKAVNANGDSLASNSVTVTPSTLPSPPTALSAVSGSGQADISFTAGANGGAAISNYKYSLDGTLYTALSTPDATSPIRITGLTNMTSYSITLKAVNASGDSVASASISVTPGKPNAPTNVRKVSVDVSTGIASITFDKATILGGGTITNYQYSLDGGTYTALSPADATAPINVSGFTNGSSHTVSLKTVTTIGVSDPSNQADVTTHALAPTGLSAVSGNGQAVISFTAGASGGPILNYYYSLDGTTYTALSPAQTTSPITITGLTNGTSYSIYLKATNNADFGTGGSLASSPVAAAPIAYAITYDLNSGSGTAIDNGSFSVGGSAVTLPLVGDRTRTGYSFGGWSTTSNGATVGLTYTPASSLTLYAVWTINSFVLTVTQGSNGTISPATTTVNYGATQAFSITPATGYSISTVLIDGVNNSGAVSGGSYTFSSVSTTHTITATYLANVNEVTFSTLSGITYGSSPAVLSATSTSSLPVVFTSTTLSVCTVSGLTITVLAAGTCTVAANQSGDSNYSAAAQVTQDLVIAKASQTITFLSLSGVTLGGSSPAELSATSTSSLPVVFTSTTLSTCTVSGSTISIVAVGTCTIAANQTGDSNFAPATQVLQGFTIAAAPIAYAITYDLNSGSGTAIANGSFTAGSAAVTLPLVGDLARTGYTFSGWSTTSSGVTVGLTYTPTSSLTLYAVWIINTFAMTVTQGSNGTISPATTTVNYGTNQVLTITPATGYSIATVLIDGVNNTGAVSASSYTFSSVSTSHTITATYSLIPVAPSGGGGGGSSTPDPSIAATEAAAAKAIAKAEAAAAKTAADAAKASTDKSAADAKAAADKVIADAKVAADKAAADTKAAEEKVIADAKAVADAKVAADKAAADAKAVADKAVSDAKAVADAKVIADKATADAKVVTDKAVADAKVIADAKATADAKIAADSAAAKVRDALAATSAAATKAATDATKLAMDSAKAIADAATATKAAADKASADAAKLQAASDAAAKSAADAKIIADAKAASDSKAASEAKMAADKAASDKSVADAKALTDAKAAVDAKAAADKAVADKTIADKAAADAAVIATQKTVTAVAFADVAAKSATVALSAEAAYRAAGGTNNLVAQNTNGKGVIHNTQVANDKNKFIRVNVLPPVLHLLSLDDLYNAWVTARTKAATDQTASIKATSEADAAKTAQAAAQKSAANAQIAADSQAKAAADAAALVLQSQQAAIDAAAAVVNALTALRALEEAAILSAEFARAAADAKTAADSQAALDAKTATTAKLNAQKVNTAKAAADAAVKKVAAVITQLTKKKPTTVKAPVPVYAVNVNFTLSSAKKIQITKAAKAMPAKSSLICYGNIQKAIDIKKATAVAASQSKAVCDLAKAANKTISVSTRQLPVAQIKTAIAGFKALF